MRWHQSCRPSHSFESLVNEILQDAYDKQVIEGGRLDGLTRTRDRTHGTVLAGN